jgi:methionyl-tRNA synthetase
MTNDWVQFMAKDNVPFHTILFPATLMAANLNFFPTHISSTHYLLFDDKKFSKSDGVGITCEQVIKISDRLDIDEDYWRYYLLRIRPETDDSSFTVEHFCEVIKGELAQKIGNLVNRTLMLIKQIYGQIPIIKYDFTLHPEKLIKMNDILVQYIESFDKFAFRNVITIINTLASIGNKWYAETSLSTTCKSDPEKYEYLAGNAAYIVWLLSELCEPIMPKKSAQMKRHFCVFDIPKFGTYNDIFEILKCSSGTINIDHSDVKIMFRQILPKQFIE